jgi:hypothetical protein
MKINISTGEMFFVLVTRPNAQHESVILDTVTSRIIQCPSVKSRILMSDSQNFLRVVGDI